MVALRMGHQEDSHFFLLLPEQPPHVHTQPEPVWDQPSEGFLGHGCLPPPRGGSHTRPGRWRSPLEVGAGRAAE